MVYCRSQYTSPGSLPAGRIQLLHTSAWIAWCYSTMLSMRCCTITVQHTQTCCLRQLVCACCTVMVQHRMDSMHRPAVVDSRSVYAVAEHSSASPTLATGMYADASAYMPVAGQLLYGRHAYARVCHAVAAYLLQHQYR